MTKDEALKLALEALVNTDSEPSSKSWKREIEALTAIKEAMAQPEQKPVAVVHVRPLIGNESIPQTRIEWKSGRPVAGPLYTTPPHRKPLTDEEVEKCYETTGHYQTLRPQDRFTVFALARAIEAAHGIKGEA